MSATDDNSAEASTGISKIIVSLDSINVPGLRFICKTLYEDEYEQLGASPRKRELLRILKKNEADVISFGTIGFKISEGKTLHLTVPLSAPFACDESDKVRIRKLSDWKQELEDLEEEERALEYYIISFNNGEFSDLGTSNLQGIQLIKAYYSYRPRIDQFTILYLESNISILDIANKIKAETDSANKKKVEFQGDTEKQDERREQSEIYKRFSTPKAKLNFSGLPKPDDGPESWAYEDDSSEEEQEDSENKRNTLQWFGVEKELAEKDQAKLKVDVKVIGFEDLKTVREWYTILQFQLDLQGITCARLRVGQLLNNLKTNLKTTIINKLGRMRALPSMEDAFDCLLECSMFTSIDAKKSTDKFAITLQKPVIEQFYRLRGLMERAWPQNSEKAIIQMTRSKFEEKLPKAITNEGLFKYRDDDIDTSTYLKLIQKIADSTDESRTMNVLKEITCNFCAKKGHKWKECRKRLKGESANKDGSKSGPNSNACNHCGIPGHKWIDCRKRLREQGGGKTTTRSDYFQKKDNGQKAANANNYRGNADFKKNADSSKKQIECWNCGKTGHYKSNCRSPRKLNFTELTQEGAPPSYEKEFRGEYTHDQ
ncbi:unnamed protein product [Oikopleura dioica]|uniref:CCHC-type domain-containing protein n=1 Tax=Oikopleura dioica TaxID=34765 RepID=E4XME8_OIKDI|nr:unnamed protein product [Oikopleura dioica]